jgi:hypothetical protein
MMIAPGHKHVATAGRVYLPALHKWDRNSSLAAVVDDLAKVFAEAPFIYARPTAPPPSLNASVQYPATLSMQQPPPLQPPPLTQLPPTPSVTAAYPPPSLRQAAPMTLSSAAAPLQSQFPTTPPMPIVGAPPGYPVVSPPRQTRSQPVAVAAASSEDGVGGEDDSCVICLDRKKAVVFLPCRHMCVCRECSDPAKLQFKCPTCRGKIADKIEVFR